MTHRTDAEANLKVVQRTLAEIQGVPTPADVSIANAARAQAIATTAVAQAILALADTINQQQEQP